MSVESGRTSDSFALGVFQHFYQRSDSGFLPQAIREIRNANGAFSSIRNLLWRELSMHAIHHRGQLTVYLRLNDALVPAIYGPSADEGRFG